MDPRDTVRPHGADAPPDTKLLQSSSRSFFWAYKGSPDYPAITEAICPGVGKRVEFV
jgi:hypothetical protein